MAPPPSVQQDTGHLPQEAVQQGRPTPGRNKACPCPNCRQAVPGSGSYAATVGGGGRGGGGSGGGRGQQGATSSGRSGGGGGRGGGGNPSSTSKQSEGGARAEATQKFDVKALPAKPLMSGKAASPGAPKVRQRKMPSEAESLEPHSHHRPHIMSLPDPPPPPPCPPPIHAASQAQEGHIQGVHPEAAGTSGEAKEGVTHSRVRCN